MIEELLTIFEGANLVALDSVATIGDGEDFLSDEDIADAIWLALQIGAESIESLDESELDDKEDVPKPSRGKDTQIKSKEPEGNVSAYIPPPSLRSAGVGNISEPEQGFEIEVEAAPALRNPLEIGRAFRPLMRKIASSSRQVIDESATVHQVAEKEIWLPILKGAPERWFDVALIVEQSEFSFIWQSTISEFQQILERLGAFRNVHVWHLRDVEKEQLTLVPQHLGKTPVRSRSPKELVDPSGRTLVVMISDCRSSVWRSGSIHRWLRLWSQKEPTLILQLLPERCWSESELDVGYGVQVSSISAGAVNSKLSIWESARRRPIAEDKALLLPIATLTPESLKQWALVVAGAGNQRSPARWFNLEWVADVDSRKKGVAIPSEQTAEAKVEYFFGTASPIAKQLAKLMSAVPVNLSVVHLIQKRLLPNSDVTHIAEVFNSDLLELRHSSQGDTSQGVAHYEFAEGVRGLINDLTAEDELLSVIQELSQEIAQSLNLPPIKSFTALLSPSASWPEGAREKLLPFAQVTNQVLRRLGGDYAALAETALKYGKPLDNQTQIESDFPPLELFPFETGQLLDSEDIDSLWPPPLETETYTVITLETEASPALETFEINVATLVNQKRLLRSDQWRIQTQLQTVQGYTETLPNDIPLEMITVPSGTFMMGSPDDEPERSKVESPQHKVTISPFFMGRYPITQAQWRAVAQLPLAKIELDPEPSSFKGENRPVEQVSWFEAEEFCARLKAHTGREYRLPNEAEWEYACRAGSTTPFHFGDLITTQVANYNGSSYADGPTGKSKEETTPVDYFGYANAFGLSDMHGNVFEWCQDHWHGDYEGAPTDGSAWLTENADAGRILRGGSWGDFPRDCRSAYRLSDLPDPRFNFIGFRVSCASPRALS